MVGAGVGELVGVWVGELAGVWVGELAVSTEKKRPLSGQSSKRPHIQAGRVDVTAFRPAE